MAPRALVITLAIVGVISLIAVLLARRWKQRWLPAWLACISWSAGCVATYFFILSAWPPIPWTAAALDSEPWESVVIPVVTLCLVWPAIYFALIRFVNASLLATMLVSCGPLLAALCTTERFSAYFIGNTAWALASLLAIGINLVAMQRINNSGAGRWSLWIIVGQSLTIAALIMTCYGRFGEWATFAGVTLAMVALMRVFVSDNDVTWSDCLSTPALALNCILMMHIREYRSQPLPIWFIPLPYLIPTLVVALDQAWSQRLHPLLRVVIAAIATAALAAASIAIILKINGPAEW